MPVVRQKPGAVTYGPLAETPVDPDVRVRAAHRPQMMVMSDAIPDLRIEGKPQCHIVAVAKEDGVAAASGRVRAEPRAYRHAATEMTCAIPAAKLPEILASIQQHSGADNGWRSTPPMTRRASLPERSQLLLAAS